VAFSLGGDGVAKSPEHQAQHSGERGIKIDIAQLEHAGEHKAEVDPCLPTMSGSEKYCPKGFRLLALAGNKIGPYAPLSTGKEVPARIFTAASQQYANARRKEYGRAAILTCSSQHLLARYECPATRSVPFFIRRPHAIVKTSSSRPP